MLLLLHASTVGYIKCIILVCSRRPETLDPVRQTCIYITEHNGVLYIYKLIIIITILQRFVRGDLRLTNVILDHVRRTLIIVHAEQEAVEQTV